MKKCLVILVVLFSCLCYAQVNAQQLVSTSPTFRNVLIEDFTGRMCVNCPDAHLIVNNIVEQNLGRVWSVNIHSGYFSPTTYPNMNTSIGETLLNGFSIQAFPMGHVNRSTSTPLGREVWASTVESQLSQMSEVNMAGYVNIDRDTRMVDITLEIYYTSNSSESSNYLSIIMLQDSIMGSQLGSQYNPSQIINGQYCHMHVLRDMITSDWGDEISPTTAGTLITKNYTYEIPETIGSPNGVEVDIDNIHFIAFITEKYQGIPTRPILNVCEINEAEILVYNAEICEGDSYNEYGFDFDNPVPGSYHDSYINEDGNIVMLNLIVHPTYETDMTAEICEGENYTQNGFNLLNPSVGVHDETITLETVNGCDSIVNLTLTVHPTYETNMTAEICEGENYTQNGFNLLNPSVGVHDETITLETVNGCDSIVNLTLTVYPTYETDITAEICEGENYTQNGFNLLNPSVGVHNETITLETVNGCDSIVNLTLTVYPTYETDMTAEICEGENYTQNGFNLLNPSVGVHNETITLETVNGCDSIVNLTLTVIDNPDITISGNTNIVEGESTVLTASGADSYEWSTGETTASITVSPTENTTYHVVGYISGCENEAQVTVFVVPDALYDNNDDMISIFPNPVYTEINIQYIGMQEISVYNLNGQKIETIIVTTDTYILNVGDYKPGIYYLRIAGMDEVIVKKIIKK